MCQVRADAPIRRALILASLLPVAMLSGCRAEPEAPPVHDGPILLITLEGLRADAVGALGGPEGLTPQLDLLAAGADWAGSAVASSSWSIPSMASLWTGLRPWQHLAIVPREKSLGPELVLLPEVLAAAGFRTEGFYDGPDVTPGAGYDRGFDRLSPFGRGGEATAHLRHLTGERELVWVHIAAPTFPYQRREAFLPRLAQPPPDLPPRVGARTLEPYFDPRVSLPAPERRMLAAMYQLEAAWVDERIGRLLRALEASGQAPRTLVAVVSAYGQELGEHDQVGVGGNLGRALVEVPLIVKLPAGFERPLAAGAGGRVAATRLWATLVEAAGGAAPPGVAPSLFTAAAPAGVLSELYRAGVHNELSWLEDDWQLRRLDSFAQGERAYFQARRAGLGLGPRPREAPRRLFSRLGRTFWTTPPLTGDGSPPRLILERWVGDGVERVEDPARAREMARRLERAWYRFVDRERSPEREVERRQPG